jgi:hypothetical protein
MRPVLTEGLTCPGATAGIVVVAIMASVEKNRVGICAMLAVVTALLLVSFSCPPPLAFPDMCLSCQAGTRCLQVLMV